jgi:mRNA-degrading endonuclease RelE of RelBE toxin-antitoxin system
MKNWTLLVAKPARKALEKLPSKDQVRIERALDELENDPFSGDTKRLQPVGWRRRVGDYRIFYDLFSDDQSIVVTAIKRRTSTTYR